jgi:hypothetical protein
MLSNSFVFVAGENVAATPLIRLSIVLSEICSRPGIARRADAKRLQIRKR